MGLRRIGYPCIRRGSDQQTVKRCQLKNASPERLRELISRNFNCLFDVLSYNLEQSIRLFRIHSDTIPFASHEDVNFDWLDFAGERLAEIGGFIEENDIRVSMHPGQYTVLNSNDEDVVRNAIRNLQYHADFLDALGVDDEAKIIIHIGGVYGERSKAIDRFVGQANNLDQSIQDRLVVENDETNYSIEHLLEIGERTNLPVVFDWLHHQLNFPEQERSLEFWLRECFKTWTDTDGVPKTHFSSPRDDGNGHHADRINSEDFAEFIEKTDNLGPFDVMLECKDKELALHELCDELQISPVSNGQSG